MADRKKVVEKFWDLIQDRIEEKLKAGEPVTNDDIDLLVVAEDALRARDLSGRLYYEIALQRGELWL